MSSLLSLRPVVALSDVRFVLLVLVMSQLIRTFKPPQTLITIVIHTPQMVNPIKEHFVSFSIESLDAFP